MRLSPKIVSLFFLSIFSMFVLHQVLPHVHHEHENLASIVPTEDHHNNHEANHHHHGDEENDDTFDLLDLLLGNHSHSVQVENIPTAKLLAKQQFINKDASHYFLYDAQPITILNFEVRKSNFGNAPPGLVSKVFLSSFFLRGPPSLS